jgi:hypothetical protein
LKRGFRYESNEYRWLAPLELDVILEMPYWTKISAPVGSFEDTF